MQREDDLLKYYIKHSDSRFDSLENKMDKMIGFRWLLIGMAAGVSGMVSFLFQMATTISGSK
jgi:hypothetical protein